jgi:Leucine-rich repeat (LRR) protein
MVDQNLRFLPALTQLEELTLSRAGITNAGMCELGSFPSLHTLNLNETTVTCEGVQSFLQLTSLNMSGYRRITHVAFLSSLKKLAKLYLENCEILDLEAFSSLPTLQALDLSRCDQISDDDLGALRGLSALRSLSLRCCFLITGVGFNHLSSLTALQELQAGGCNIGNEGLKMLVASLPSLTKLNVASSNFTHGGMKGFSALTALKELNLNNNAVQDKGLRLLPLASLRYVDLSMCRRITAAHVQEMRTTAKHIEWVTCQVALRT